MAFQRIKIAAAAAVLGSGAIYGAAQAHHAFSAEFDADAPVLLRGEVTRVEWVNPHTWVHMRNVGGEQRQGAWMVEGGTPNPC